MRKIYQLWGISLVIKIIIATFLPLSYDESYYWIWSNHLQLSYFDHPPFVAWLFKLGHYFDFFKSGVRIPALILSHLTLWVWVCILKPFLDLETLFIWLLVAACAPLLGLSGYILTPDLPLMFFWSLGFYFLIQAQKNPNAKNFILLGATLGLGFCAKYHIALFLPIALVWLYLEKFYSLKNIKLILLGFLFFILFSSPVLIWNYQHDFISFKFQLAHGLKGGGWKPEWTLQYLISQVLLFFPCIVYYSIISRSEIPKTYQRLFKLFCFLPLLFFLYSSFKARVEANWTGIAFPFALSLALFHKHKHRWPKYALGLWIGGVILILSQIFYTWMPSNYSLKTKEFTEFENVSKALIPKIINIDRPLFSRNYQSSSKLSFILRRDIYKLRGMNRFDFFDMIPKSLPTRDYMVLTGINEPLPLWTANHRITEVIPITRDYELKLVSINEQK